jgi:hypothetical protein
VSTVKLLQDEFQLWQAHWRQVEAFMERIDEASAADDEYRRKFLALLDVVTAIEDERRIRSGVGLAAPLEIALRRGDTGVDKKGELEGDPGDSHRVPGAYDLEIAVAPINIPYDKPIDDPSKLTNVALTPNEHALFTVYDETSEAWRTISAPSYDFGKLTGDDAKSISPNTDGGLYPLLARQLRALLPPLPPPVTLPDFGPSWSSFKAQRQPPPNEPNLFSAMAAGVGVPGIAAKAQALCNQGAAAVQAAAQKLENDDFVEIANTSQAASFVSRIKKTADAFKARAEVYGNIASGQTPATVALLAALPDLGGSIQNNLGTVLDAVVEERIRDPDGTARSLRMLEWSFSGFWYVRKAWFKDRKKRRLDRLLLQRFLETFLSEFAAAYRGQATSFPVQAKLTRSVFINGEYLYLPDGTGGLDELLPGMVAAIDGERKAIAIVLGSDPTTDGHPRIRVLPLQISMAAGGAVPGIAGMVNTASVSAGPLDGSLLTAQNLRDGTVKTAPQHDGLVQELAAHWSRLCLIYGSDAVAQRINGDLPTHLPRKLRLPVLGPVSPNATRLVLDVGALKAAGFDLDGPTQPILARPGEMLLLVGKDSQGAAWQGVVEVMTITRTTADQVDKDAPSPPLGKPICCQDPGDRLIIQVKGTSFPVTLMDQIRLHRDFQGFGTPSLAAGKLLPAELDPESGGSSPVYRGPELKAARQLLGRWMWTR